MNSHQSIPLIARILMSIIFLWSGTSKILAPVATQDYMAAAGMKFTDLFLVLAIAIELLGGLSLLLGYKTRWGSLVLIVFVVAATAIFHTNLTDRMQQIQLLKNLFMVGGLLMVFHFGSGAFSLDRRIRSSEMSDYSSSQD
jgi:putative oxidoreductase